MRVWKAVVGLCVLTLICSGVAALGDDTNNNNTNNNNNMGNGNDQIPPDQVEAPPPEAPENPPAAQPAPAPTYGPLMTLFEQFGFGKPMENLGFNIHGYVEGGYLYDLNVPHNTTPPRSAPGDMILFAGPYKNEPMLNQADLTIERDMVNLPKGDWDFGGLVEVGYGRDDFFTHSNGILDQHNKQGGTGLDDQLDILQLYGQFGIPVGTGLTLEAGKFESFLGYEKIDPTQNLFYTHSYGFSFGKPFTNTGAFASYTFKDPSAENVATLTGGISRGWNQSIYDNNGDIDGIIQLKNTLGSSTWYANIEFGPEGVLPYGPADHGHWWVTPEGIVSFNFDPIVISADLLYGDAPDLTQWFSAAVYFQYKIDPHMLLGARVEYYHDGRGVTTGVGGTDINYAEVTLGTTLMPFPDSPFLDTLGFRPEVRFDTADNPVLDASKHTQVTVACDIIYRY
jgi:hypothetical protein